jgi:hypothetical protein
MKTSDLIGPALDWAVAKCEYIHRTGTNTDWFDRSIPTWINAGQELIDDKDDGSFEKWVLGGAYSEQWAQGGPIIEREEIGLKRNAPCSIGCQWEASPSITAKGAGGKWGYGPTPLIAAMRCYVASKLGDEIEIPEELK